MAIAYIRNGIALWLYVPMAVGLLPPEGCGGGDGAAVVFRRAVVSMNDGGGDV